MNKSACLADIIDSVQNLEDAVQKDIGVIRMCILLCVTVTVYGMKALPHGLLVIVMSAVLHQA